jgi:hypothetical protein
MRLFRASACPFASGRRSMTSLIRAALILVLASLSVVAVPAGAGAPALRCGSASTQSPWQAVPIPAFPGVPNVQTQDKVTLDAVDPRRPERLLVSNGTTIQASSTNGCDWRRVTTLDANPPSTATPSGVTARFVALLLVPQGRALAAVADGTGEATRPHVLSSDTPTSGAYQLTDAGLPAEGVPESLTATADGGTVYLSIRHAAASVPGPVGVPTVPAIPGGPAATPAAVPSSLYVSLDAGRTWNARATNARDLGQVAVEPANAQVVLSVAHGAFAVSRDGGQRFSPVPVPGLGSASVVTTASPRDVVVSGAGGTFSSVDSGQTWRRITAGPATSLAIRSGDTRAAVAADGRIQLIDRATGGSSAGTAATPGLLLADQGTEPTFHAIDGHRLLRFVDPGSPATTTPAAVVTGDIPPPPPRQGILTPSSVNLNIPSGSSRTVQYQLALPANPTPLNVYFLVDVSSTLSDYQDQLNSSITAITQTLARKGVSLRAGIGTIGTGPSKGRPDYPQVSAGVVDVAHPTQAPRPYRKPSLYHLLRRLGPVDAGFYQAVANVRTETLPSPNYSANSNDARSGDPADPEEGQLLAMEQSVNPSGVLDPTSTPELPRYRVPGGQEAGFQPDPFQRNILLTATDEFFANPAGSPDKADGSLDFTRVIHELKNAQVQSIGLTIGETGSSSSLPDLSTMATGTGAIAPPGGLACSDTERIPAGRPLVCTNSSNFGSLLSNVLSTLKDVQALTASVQGDSTVVQQITAPALANTDVSKAHTLPLSVTYSCQDRAPGLHSNALTIRLRGYVVGNSQAQIHCIGVPAPAVLRPHQATVPADHAAPGPGAAPPAVVPPAPVAHPQAQTQTQTQTQTQSQTQAQTGTAGARQQQEQEQLALALNDGSLPQDTPATTGQMAMVHRARNDEQAAFLVLTTALVACSALGLARLRHDAAPRAQRAH